MIVAFEGVNELENRQVLALVDFVPFVAILSFTSSSFPTGPEHAWQA